MTQTKAAKPKTETVFPMFEIPQFEMPKFDGADMPVAFRDMTDKAVAQTKDVYDKCKAAAEEATEVLEDTFAASSKHATDLNKAMLANAKANINASFDFAEKMFGVKTVAEAVELQSQFARKQFELLSAQTKDIQSKAQKAAEDCSKPAKERVSKVVEQFKVDAA